MSTNERELSPQDRELVALGASVGAGCHPCLDHHLVAAKKAELAGDRVLAAITTAQQVAAQAAQGLAHHIRQQFDPTDHRPAARAALDTELVALGAGPVPRSGAGLRNPGEAGGPSPFALFPYTSPG